jgi:LysM repeat protein
LSAGRSGSPDLLPHESPGREIIVWSDVMKRFILITAIVVVMAAVSVVPAVAQGAPGGWYTGVYDRGARPHAMGTVWGNLYYVVRGDTLFSIGQRFGLYWPVIAQANGIFYPPYTPAGQYLVIPGLGIRPPHPIPPRPYPPEPIPPRPYPPDPPSPTPIPPVTPIPPAAPAIRIDSPPPGAVLPATFVVSGRGRNLHEGNVVVRAYNAQRVLLAEKATVLQGPNVGTGGEGTWSVQLTVNTPPGTQGAIEATSPQPTPARAAVAVVFGSGSSGSGTIYRPGECQIQAAAGKPLYNAPNGQVIGNFTSGGWFDALERQLTGGMNWYKIQPGGSAGGPPAWVPTSSLVAVSPGCR